MLKNTLKIAVLATGLLVPGVALAAANAIVTTDLNIRAGPSVSYQRLGTIREGDNVLVHGCARGYDWCDVSWAGRRGWVSANYLAYLGERYNRQPIASVGVSIGLPIVGFERDHRRHYNDDFHRRDRGRRFDRDRHFDRDDRRHHRIERRDRDFDHRRGHDRDFDRDRRFDRERHVDRDDRRHHRRDRRVERRDRGRDERREWRDR